MHVMKAVKILKNNFLIYGIHNEQKPFLLQVTKRSSMLLYSVHLYTLQLHAFLKVRS